MIPYLNNQKSCLEPGQTNSSQTIAYAVNLQSGVMSKYMAFIVIRITNHLLLFVM